MAINKKGKYIRMAPHANELLKKLSKKLNDSESNVVAEALECLAKKLKVKVG